MRPNKLECLSMACIKTGIFSLDKQEHISFEKLPFDQKSFDLKLLEQMSFDENLMKIY